jgi:hypothetical protein
MRALPLVLLLAFATQARAQDSLATKPLRTLVWSELKAQGAALPGSILPATDERPFEALRVENKTGMARTITVATLDDPGITASRWMFSGEVHYEKVLGKGYLELLNHLTDGGVYFSRTLAPDGPMGWMTGSSGWRPFALPFNAWKAGNRPTRIVVSVILPQRGVVDLSPIEIYQGLDATP